MTIKDTIKQEIATLCAIEAKDIQDDRLLLEYGLDSVRTLEMCCFVEDMYDIEIADEEAAEVKTMNDVMVLINKKLEN